MIPGNVVDRVYKAGVSELRQALQDLRREFSRLPSSTDWTGLRVDPLLTHARSLERLLRSPRYQKEFTRLRKGVVLFHSDLVYLRENVKHLRRLLDAELNRTQTRDRRPRRAP